jgi:hypothetical protein
MEEQKERPCPDCGGGTHYIQLFDKGHGQVHHDLEYALPEAKRGRWLPMFPVEGKIIAYLCDGCGRVLLYAQPYE